MTKLQHNVYSCSLDSAWLKVTFSCLEKVLAMMKVLASLNVVKIVGCWVDVIKAYHTA